MLSEAEAAAKPAQAGQPKVLLVEDDELLLSLYAQILAGAEFEVEAVGNGTAAIESIRRSRPDILLTDFQLPGADGLEICLAMREQFPKTVIPVLIVTAGDVSGKRIEEALRIPGVMICRKPVRVAALPKLLHALHEHWYGDGSADTGEAAVEAAKMVEDDKRTLPGEALDTVDLAVARRWLGTYQDLAEFKRLMITTVEKQIQSADAAGKHELETTDLVFLHREEDRFVKRIAYWRERVAELEGDA